MHIVRKVVGFRYIDIDLNNFQQWCRATDRFGVVLQKHNKDASSTHLKYNWLYRDKTCLMKTTIPCNTTIETEV